MLVLLIFFLREYSFNLDRCLIPPISFPTGEALIPLYQGKVIDMLKGDALESRFSYVIGQLALVSLGRWWNKIYIYLLLNYKMFLVWKNKLLFWMSRQLSVRQPARRIIYVHPVPAEPETEAQGVSQPPVARRALLWEERSWWGVRRKHVTCQFSTLTIHTHGYFTPVGAMSSSWCSLVSPGKTFQQSFRTWRLSFAPLQPPAMSVIYFSDWLSDWFDLNTPLDLKPGRAIVWNSFRTVPIEGSRVLKTFLSH